MKKLFVAFVVLALASMAFAQAPVYDGNHYTGTYTPRTTEDTKLGLHDVFNSAGTDRMGCQSCHIPHNALASEYLWKYTPKTTVGTVTLPTLDDKSFHSIACFSCHDSATAAGVIGYGATMESRVFIYNDAMGAANDHPIDEIVGTHGTPALTFVRTYGKNTDAGATGATGLYGYVECGSCHDPHKGAANQYKFLRAPSGTNASPDTGRLTLCRDCHGK